MATNLSNLGAIYADLGDAQKALDYYQRTYEIHKKLGDLQAMTIDLGNIRYTHNMRADPFKTRNITNKFLLSERLDDLQPHTEPVKKKKSFVREPSDLEKALKHHKLALTIHESMGDITGMATELCQIGLIYTEMNKSEDALENLQRAYLLYEKMGDIQSIIKRLKELKKNLVKV